MTEGVKSLVSCRLVSTEVLLQPVLLCGKRVLSDGREMSILFASHPVIQ